MKESKKLDYKQEITESFRKVLFLWRGSRYRKKYTVPPEAYKEALANADVYRAWDIEARVRVSMFDDRIEISSPGGCYTG